MHSYLKGKLNHYPHPACNLQVEDTNTPFLCSELHDMGWLVTRVVMLPDNADSIASELRLLSPAVDVVITMGGVGPTLDDVTMAGVARAFNKAIIRSVESLFIVSRL